MPSIDLTSFGSLVITPTPPYNSDGITTTGPAALVGTGNGAGSASGHPFSFGITGKPTGGSLSTFAIITSVEVHITGSGSSFDGTFGAQPGSFHLVNPSATLPNPATDSTHIKSGSFSTLADVQALVVGWTYFGDFSDTGSVGSTETCTVSAFFVRVFYESIDVTAITPNNGPIAGGTTVIIQGDGFSTVTGVTFNGNAATHVVVVNSNTITCKTPPGAPSVFIDVVITATDGSIATLPASYQYRNVLVQWTVNNIPSIGGNPPTVPLDYNDPITVVPTQTPLSITYVPTVGPPITIVLDPTNPIMPALPGINPIAPIILTGPPFIGSVPLALFTITIINGSGLYVITPGATNDTLYVNSTVDNTTAQVKFPDPFIKTAFLP